MTRVEFEEPNIVARSKQTRQEKKERLTTMISILVVLSIVAVFLLWDNSDSDQNIKKGESYVPAEY